MTEAAPKLADAGSAAPLFVTAYSPKGQWQETLLERGQSAPAWFAFPHHVRIQAPSGEARDAVHRGGKPEEAYDVCLALLGEKRVWAPRLDDLGTNPVAGLEVWTLENAPVSVTEGTVLTVRRSGETKSGSPIGLCYAAIRRKDKSAVWVRSTGWFYLDRVYLANGMELVPRAILDLGLAGAFWGFTEHQNTRAAMLAAQRLLDRVSKNTSRTCAPTWIAAAAHAVLAHRDLLPLYGESVLALLEQKNAPEPDALFLKALVGMARLSDHCGNKEKVKGDVRAAITALANRRALFGETVRWLDAKFDVIRHLALRDLYDGELTDELSAISDWLGNSFAGGQGAVYLGEVPLEGDGWHDALAEKKTPRA